MCTQEYLVVMLVRYLNISYHEVFVNLRLAFVSPDCSWPEVYLSAAIGWLRRRGLAKGFFGLLQTLANCRERVCKELDISVEECELSMGMSGDFELAVSYHERWPYNRIDNVYLHVPRFLVSVCQQLHLTSC